jgi:hypothetical protein
MPNFLKYGEQKPTHPPTHFQHIHIGSLLCQPSRFRQPIPHMMILQKILKNPRGLQNDLPGIKFQVQSPSYAKKITAGFACPRLV